MRSETVTTVAALVQVLFGIGCGVPDTNLEDERLEVDNETLAQQPSLEGGSPLALTPDGPPNTDASVATAVAGPPEILGLAVETGECVVVRLAADQPVTATAAFLLDGREQRVTSKKLARQHEWASAVFEMPPGAVVQLEVTVRNELNLEAQRAVAPVVVPRLESGLVITEVLSNPRGSEFTQEFVEILNLASTDIALGDLLVEDAAGSDPLPPTTLVSGARALIVAESYAIGTEDPAPASGVPLLRVSGRIGRDGLTNGGEVVRLVTAAGDVVASYGGYVNAGDASWNGKSIVRSQTESPCDLQGAWARTPQDPTPGW